VLTGIDIALLVILGLSTLVGLWRGFVVEVMSLAVWVAAFWLAFAFGDEAAAWFENHVQSASARLFLGYALLFFGALLAGGLATWLMGKLVKSTGLSGTDRLLGMGFGLFRGAALACLGVLLLGFTPLPQGEDWRQSRLVPGFQQGAEWLKTWLPAAVSQHIRFDLPELPTPTMTEAAVRETIDGPGSDE
jgi:membrane protein required for colicin V production